MSATAQDNDLSLATTLKNSPQDSSKVDAYISLYDSLRGTEPEKALSYLKQSLQIAEATDFKEGKLKSLLVYGDYLDAAGKLDSALLIYKNAEKIAQLIKRREKQLQALIGQGKSLTYLQRLKEADSITQIAIEIAKQEPIDSLGLAKCYNNLSNIAYYRDEDDASIAYDQQSLAYNVHNLSMRARSLLNIGSTHFLHRDFDKANVYFIEALDNAEKADDKDMMASAYLELGRLKTQQESYDEARHYYDLALQRFKTTNNKVRIASILNNLGEIQLMQKQYDKAIVEYQSALDILNEMNTPFNKGSTIYKLGVTYLEKQEYSKAESYLLEAKSVYDSLDNANMQKWVSSRLSDLYAATNNYKMAYYYLKDVRIKDDSLFTANQIKNFQDIEEKYQNAQKQQEIELLSAENQIAELEIEKQTNFRNYLIIAAILLALLIGVIYNRYTIKAKANIKLRELDTVKTNFFTNISHEFRTPLTLILSPLQKLREQTKDKETSANLTVIHRNATLLTELTNQLLELSKLESGSLLLAVSEENLKAFLCVLCASFESLATAQNITLITNLEEAPEMAYYDSDKVQKIINNLLSNAFKFTSAEGKVILTVTQNRNKLSIAVSDTGKGISKEDQAHIFNRFYQSRRNTASSAGTGIGLTLAKELAELHKGDIKIISKTGEGAKFVFEFPIDRESYSDAQLVEHHTEVPTMIPIKSIPIIQDDVEPDDESKTQILVVEDNPDLRAHICHLLQPHYNVKHAINGKAGVEAAITSVPDLIITDLMMPEMDGIELNEVIKNNDKTSHIPVILLTAKADRDTKLESLKTGADDFLVKPFDNEELLVRIENIISQRKKLQEKYAQTLTLAPSKITIKSKEEAFIKKALEIVDHNVANSQFTVQHFQQEMGMSRMQLHRKLKALTNFSASEFVRDIRLQRAADLLRGNNLNVSEVAYSCGFNSVSYFTQCFTQKYGVNPSKHTSQKA